DNEGWVTAIWVPGAIARDDGAVAVDRGLRSEAADHSCSFHVNEPIGVTGERAILRQQSPSPTVAPPVRASEQRENGCTMLSVFEIKKKFSGADSMLKKRITLLFGAMFVFLPSISALV